MTDRTKILDRVRKLMALSRRASEHEAANAAARAARLMAKYGISSVEAEQEIDDPISDNRDLYVVISKGARYPAWKWNLCWHIAEATRCKPLPLHCKDGDHVLESMVAFIGRRSDAEVCCYLAQYFMTELQQIHRTKRPEIGSMVGGVAMTRTTRDAWSRDFYLGAVVTLARRMREAQDDEMQHASSTALVRLRQIDDRVMAKAREAGISYYSKPNEVDVRFDDGFSAGVAAGEQIDLGRGERASLGVGAKQIRGSSDPTD